MQPSALFTGPSASASYVHHGDNARLGQTKDPELSDEDRRGPVERGKRRKGDWRTEAMARGLMKKAEELLKEADAVLGQKRPHTVSGRRYSRIGRTP